MRITIKDNREEIVQVVCNCCGKTLPVENGMVLEDYIHVQKRWGYFSEQDGEEIAFDLCEKCADRLIQGFRVPVYRKEARELV